MAGPFDHIVRCLDLKDQEVSEALGSRETTRALLARLAAVSAPNTGAAKALLVFARMATTACAWIDGDLCVELVGDGDTTTIEAAAQLGGGLRERLLPATRLRAPIGEFSRAIERVPHMVAPLVVRAKSSRRVSLVASDVVRRTSAPPPPVEIAENSLFVRAESPGLPKGVDALPDALPDVDAGWDD